MTTFTRKHPQKISAHDKAKYNYSMKIAKQMPRRCKTCLPADFCPSAPPWANTPTPQPFVLPLDIAGLHFATGRFPSHLVYWRGIKVQRSWDIFSTFRMNELKTDQHKTKPFWANVPNSADCTVYELTLPHNSHYTDLNNILWGTSSL